jgi:hypothetical protein
MTFKVLDLDVRKIIQELTESGELSASPKAYLENRLAVAAEKHSVCGDCDWARSNTLSTWIAKHGLPVRRLVIFACIPGLHTRWHRDGDDTLASVNIPWWGTADTLTEFYDGGGLKPNDVFTSEGRVLRIDGFGEVQPTHVDCLHEHASALNIDKWHRINSLRAKENRAILSMRFPRHYSYNQLCTDLRL